MVSKIMAIFIFYFILFFVQRFIAYWSRDAPPV